MAESDETPSRGPGGLRLPFSAGATDLFQIAKRAAQAQRATAETLTPGRLHEGSLVAIVFSVLSVEGFFNELASLDYWTEQQPSLVATDVRLTALQRVLTLAEEANVQSPKKLLLAYEILGQSLDGGGAMVQDYSLLKKLRDAIVHPKRSSVAITGTPVTFRSSREKLLRALESRGLLPFDPTSRGMPFLAWLSSERVAPWALGVASKVVLSTIGALPAGPFRQATELFLRDFSLQP